MPTPTDAVYRLTGVCLHHGTSPVSGHYTFIKQDCCIPIQIDDDTFRMFDGQKYLLIVICYSMNEFRTTRISAIATFPIF